MGKPRLIIVGLSLIVGLFFIGGEITSVYAQSYNVILNVLNPPNDAGEIAVVSGDDIEVEFSINDPFDELSNNDIIQLISVEGGEAISHKKRGKNLIGTVSLKTEKNDAPAGLVVEYVHNGEVIATYPDLSTMPAIIVLADQASLAMLERIGALEATDPVPGPQGPRGEKGDKPAHQWDQTSLQFENPDGTWGDLVDLKGEKGDTGDQGIQGIQGFQGDPGPKGDQGDQGIQGIQGDTGADGAQGLKGDKGDTGADGEQGPPGECDCPITQEQLDELYSRIEHLENYAVIGRFTDMGDGTIRDNHTGLIWLKDASCNDLGRYSGQDNWDFASTFVAALQDGLCGLTDGSMSGSWRHPTRSEWNAFLSLVYTNPALVNTLGDGRWEEGDIFVGVRSWGYWTNDRDEGQAWMVDVTDGSMVLVHPHDPEASSWPVRSGF